MGNDYEENNEKTIECSNEISDKDSKKVVKNIIIVAISNIIKLLSGILVVFLVPKMMGETNYGFYKTFTLYLGYVGLLHFGFCDGIYLIYGGKKKEDFSPYLFRTYTKVLMIFQLIITTLIVLPSLIVINTDYGFIFLFVGISVIASNMTIYYQFISQITGRFKELSIRNIIQAVLTALAVTVIAVLYYFKVIDSLEYKLYIIITTVITLFLAIWYIWTYRDITFGKSIPLKEIKINIYKIFKFGFILLIANLVSNLILIIDRQFVNILVNMDLYSMADYGIYSFAYNMLTLITTVISAISVVLYPTIKSYSEERLKKDYSYLISIIAIITSFCMLSYFPLSFIIERWLPKYVNSLPIFRVILPGLLLSSCVTLIMYNYYKTMGKHMLYFIISVVILGLSIIANILAYLFTKQLLWISIVSVIVIGFWYFISDLYIIKKLKIHSIKNTLYILLIISSYFLITLLIDNIYIGFAAYFVSFLVITLMFYHKMIVAKIKR